MHLQLCGTERRVENSDFAWTCKCTSMARSWMSTTQYQKWRRSSTTYIGPHTLAKLNSQMPNIKLNLTKKQKIYAQSTHLRDCSRCGDYLRDWKTTKKQFDKRMLAVKSRLGEKHFTINEKNSNSKPVDSLSFLGHSISKEGIAPESKHVEKTKNAKAPTNNKQLESFVGLANFYGRMIPDFATKMLPLNNMRNS